MTYKIKEVNALTGEEIIRDMNELEVKMYENDVTRLEEISSNKIEKAAAKAVLLQKLGISEDEAKLLLS
jgi:hypothetical protein